MILLFTPYNNANEAQDLSTTQDHPPSRATAPHKYINKDPVEILNYPNYILGYPSENSPLPFARRRPRTRRPTNQHNPWISKKPKTKEKNGREKAKREKKMMFHRPPPIKSM